MPSVLAAPLAFDLTRLITRLRHASPTGIDRVDLAYARHILGGAGPRYGVVTTALGPRILDRAEAMRIVETAAAGWTEHGAADADPILAGLGCDPAPPPRPDRPSDALRRRRTQVETAARTFMAGGIDRLPHGTVYLHTSHLRLDHPERFDWLYTRADVRPVFFVHDLIPLSHPEYGRDGEAARHAVRMETVWRHAAHVLVNSDDVGGRFRAHAAAHGHGRAPVTVAPLGVEPAFPAAGPAPVFDRPTFVACGTIEPRKNHLTLLNVWRALAERHGAETPRLLLVGRRGWEAENVFDMLDRCPAIRTHVREVTGLTTHGLARLMRGATALLMPSFAEGYGLPVVEAAASGLPVVASDIPVHREIAAAFAHFVDPLDGLGWLRAVENLSAPGAPLRTELAGRLAGYAPPRWEAHFDTVDAVLAGLAPAVARVTPDE